MKRRLILGGIMVLVTGILLTGCAEVVKVGTGLGEQTGMISHEQKERYDSMAEKTESSVRPMTDREEYYVGRAVAATILSQYRLYPNKRLTGYLNQVGQALALASDRPLTYGGYHFAILDSNEVNALACPGGVIFVTRGMLQLATNEEELAAIVAHEVAHVNHKDGLASIKRSRWVEAVTYLGTETAKELSAVNVDKLTELFEGSIKDVSKTLIVNGYGRKAELAADTSAMFFMHRLGYNPQGLTSFLEKLARKQDSGAGKGFFATHPGMAERLSKARSIIADSQWPRTNHQLRDQRFLSYR